MVTEEIHELVIRAVEKEKVEQRKLLRDGRVVVIINDLVRLAFNKKVRFEQRLKASEGDRYARSRGRAF